MSGAPDLFGISAEFARPEPLVEAARAAHDAGYRRLEAYTPFPVEELSEALHQPPSRVPPLTLAGGLLAGSGAYLLMTYSAVIDYPWNIGGRPHYSWPSFIPITFELTILGGSLLAVLGMLALNRLPKPHHPVFNTPGFRRASRDRFFLVIEAGDDRFDREATAAFLATLGPLRVREVPR